MTSLSYYGPLENLLDFTMFHDVLKIQDICAYLVGETYFRCGYHDLSSSGGEGCSHLSVELGI